MNIKPALPEDAARLTQLAHESKRYWGYPEHWIERWRQDLTISVDFIKNHKVFVAESEGAVVGFYALVAHPDKLELDHLWVDPEHIGKGVGKLLFLHAMETAHQQNYSNVGILSDPNAEGFYRKMGAALVGEELSEIDDQKRTLPRLNFDLESQ